MDETCFLNILVANIQLIETDPDWESIVCQVKDSSPFEENQDVFHLFISCLLHSRTIHELPPAFLLSFFDYFHHNNDISHEIAYQIGNVDLLTLNLEFPLREMIKLNRDHAADPEKVLVVMEYFLGKDIELDIFLGERFTHIAKNVSTSVLPYTFVSQLCSILIRNEHIISDNLLHADCSFIFAIFDKVVTTTINPADTDNFQEALNSQVDLVKLIWNLTPRLEGPSVRRIFDHVMKYKNKSMALSRFLDDFSAEKIFYFFKQLTQDARMVSDECLQALLSSMLCWLVCKKNKHSHLWILEFIRKLEDEEKFSILIKFARDNLSRVFFLLFQGHLRDMAWPIVAHTMKMYPGVELFQQGIEPFLIVLNHWDLQKMTEDDNKFVNECVLLMHFFLRKFPDELNAATSLHEAVQRYPKPNDYELMRFTNTNLWYDNDIRSSMATAASNDRSLLKIRIDQDERVGLENLGMTCYLNSVAQVLFMIPELRRYLYKYEQQLAESPVSHSCAVAFSFMQYTTRSHYKPISLIQKTRPSYFVDGHQEDSSEYLKHVLDRLNDEATDIYKKQQSRTEEEEAITTSNTDEFKKDWVKELFYGVHRTTITCSKCKKSVVRNDPFNTYILYLNSNNPTVPTDNSKITQPSDDQDCNDSDDDEQQSYPSKAKAFVGSPSRDANKSLQQARSITKLLQTSLQDEVMEGEDKFACEGCGEKTRAHASSSFTHLPNYLLLHLALFTYHNGANVKRMEKVELVNPLLVDHHDGTKVRYELMSVMIHQGVHAVSGHYYCYSKDYRKLNTATSASSAEDDWIVFDDASVCQIKYRDMLRDIKSRYSATPYVVCYRRCSDDNPTSSLVDPNLSKDGKLHREICADNESFRLECSEHERLRSRSNRQGGGKFTKFRGWKPSDDDDKPPPACGGSGFGGGPRLVF